MYNLDGDANGIYQGTDHKYYNSLGQLIDPSTGDTVLDADGNPTYDPSLLTQDGNIPQLSMPDNSSDGSGDDSGSGSGGGDSGGGSGSGSGSSPTTPSSTQAIPVVPTSVAPIIPPPPGTQKQISQMLPTTPVTPALNTGTATSRAGIGTVIGNPSLSAPSTGAPSTYGGASHTFAAPKVSMKVTSSQKSGSARMASRQR